MLACLRRQQYRNCSRLISCSQLTPTAERKSFTAGRLVGAVEQFSWREFGINRVVVVELGCRQEAFLHAGFHDPPVQSTLHKQRPGRCLPHEAVLLAFAKGMLEAIS